MPVSVLNVSKPWKKNELNRWLIFFSIAIIFTCLDLITKYLTYQIDPINIIPGVLELKYVNNKGIIWGLFSQGSLLFIVISCLAIPLIIFMFKYIYVFVRDGTKQEDNKQPLSPNVENKPSDIANETPVPLENTTIKDNDNDSHPERSEEPQRDSSLPLQNDCGQLSNELKSGNILQLPEMPISKFSIFSMTGILTVACAMLLAGAIGNLYDRIFYQGVRDFISFYIINWPIFNLADVFITIGAFLIIICMFKKPHTAKTADTNL